MLRTIFLNSNKRLRNGWWIAVFLAILAALLVPLIIWTSYGDGRVPLYQQLGIILIASLSCQAMRRAPIGELLGAPDLRWLRQLLLGLMLGALLMIIPAASLFLIGAVSWHVNPDAWAVLPATLALLLIAAAAEELLFRGFMFQRLAAGLGVWPAQFAIAALFTLTHADALGALGAQAYLAGANIFLASLLFGLAFLRTGSLALPIGIHFAANATQGPLLGFGVSGGEAPGLLMATTDQASPWLTGGDFGLEASVPGFLSVVALTAIVSWLRRLWCHAPIARRVGGLRATAPLLMTDRFGDMVLRWIRWRLAELRSGKAEAFGSSTCLRATMRRTASRCIHIMPSS